MVSTRCAMCAREAETTRHHLVPRCLHRRLKRKKGVTADALQETVEVCAACHTRIHEIFTEKELAQTYSSLEQLLAHEAVKEWVGWIAKRPPGFEPRTGSWKRRQR